MQKVKFYRCPIDGKPYESLNSFGQHMRKFHPSEIPSGYSDARYFYFLFTGKTHGKCIVCGKDTDWNEATQKYNRFCNNPKCKEKYREEFKNRMIGKYGKEHLLNDPEQQRKMAANKKISGKYKFEDGGEIEYMGSYERDFLFMLDQFLNLNSNDIMGPSPHNYYYLYTNKNDREHEGIHFYIPDFYIPSLNLEIEIKQNTNTHPKLLAIDKVKEYEKDDVMKSNPSVNYIKIVEKDYSDFFKIFLDLKDSIDTKSPAPLKNLSLKPMDIEATKDSPASESYLPDDDDNYIDVKKISGSLFSAKHNPVKIAAINNALKISGLKYADKTIEDNNEDINNTVILYIKNKEIVGSIELSPDNELKHLYVDEEWRNKGIATALLYCAINKFGGDHLFVYKNNKPACQLYNKVGFKVIRTDKDFYYMNLNSKTSSIATEALEYKNDDGEDVPKVCPECGSPVKVFFKGEPVFLCSNKDCNKYFGTVPFKTKENYLDTVAEEYLTDFSKYLSDYDELDEIATESAVYDDTHTYPVYIILMHNDELLSKIVKTVTDDDYTHAAISFDSSLNKLYSFGRKKSGVRDSGLTIVNPSIDFYKKYKTLYSVYVMFVTKSELDKMQRKLDWFVKNQDDMTYDYGGLILNALHLPSENKKKYFCSRFVAEILNSGIGMDRIPSMYRPQDLSELDNISLVNHGDDFAKYDKRITDKNINHLESATESSIDYDSDYEPVYEAAMYDNTHKIPIYIVLMHSGTVLANAIKSFTKDDYSHACIAFDPSLTKMYSFGRKKIDVSANGFSISSPKDEFFKKFMASYGIYVMFVTQDEYNKMQTRLDWFIEHDEELKYDFWALFLNAVHLPSEHEKKYFCSRFVAEILRSGINMNMKPSMYRPQDLSYLDNISLVNSGDDFSKYNKNITIQNVNKLKGDA